MKRAWTEVALGETCRFETGTFPTIKSVLGEFPSVIPFCDEAGNNLDCEEEIRILPLQDLAEALNLENSP